MAAFVTAVVTPIDIEGASHAVLEEAALIVRETADRVRDIITNELSGGVLNRRTGRLYGSIMQDLQRDSAHLWARIGVTDYIGRFWERGFRGDQHVRSHLRAIKTGSRLEVIKTTRRGTIRRVRVFRTGATVVKEHDRTVDGAARPFLSPAIEQVRADFMSRMQDLAGRMSA